MSTPIVCVVGDHRRAVWRMAPSAILHVFILLIMTHGAGSGSADRPQHGPLVAAADRKVMVWVPSPPIPSSPPPAPQATTVADVVAPKTEIASKTNASAPDNDNRPADADEPKSFPPSASPEIPTTQLSTPSAISDMGARESHVEAADAINMSMMTDSKLLIRFVGVEDGLWLKWLAARSGLIGLTSRREDGIDSVYTAGGEPVARANLILERWWPLEIDRPELVVALQPILQRERHRTSVPDVTPRVFTLWPLSFQSEVLAAVEASGTTPLRSFLVAFGPSLLSVIPQPGSAAR